MRLNGLKQSKAIEESAKCSQKEKSNSSVCSGTRQRVENLRRKRGFWRGLRRRRRLWKLRQIKRNVRVPRSSVSCLRCCLARSLTLHLHLYIFLPLVLLIALFNRSLPPRCAPLDLSLGMMSLINVNDFSMMSISCGKRT